ncbi:MAG: hypothetical protein Q7N95_13390 [Alphaproteobacteria bacterium]|nr:hypothetical protein [Alphaproteobacteria bacterium]
MTAMARPTPIAVVDNSSTRCLFIRSSFRVFGCEEMVFRGAKPTGRADLRSHPPVSPGNRSLFILKPGTIAPPGRTEEPYLYFRIGRTDGYAPTRKEYPDKTSAQVTARSSLHDANQEKE